MDLDRLTASQAMADLRAGRYSARSLTAACQARIDQRNGLLNALVAQQREVALVRATEADALRQRGGPVGTLAGLPVTIKDSFATADLITTASHAPLRHHRPQSDATLVARLRAAGAILLGKTHLPELAAAPHGWSRLFGHTRNPWDTARTPGGSSSGAAVAVASGFSLMDVGSDIGGSIRIPAAYCGITALKATEGRMPRTGHIPHLPPAHGGRGRSVWHLLSFGVLARCVADLHLVYNVLAGPDGMDSTVPPFEPLPPLHRLRQPLTRPLRIALWTDMAGVPVCPRTRRAFDRLARTLTRAGHEVHTMPPRAFDLHAAWRAYGHLAGAEIGLGMPRLPRLALRAAVVALPRGQPIARAMAEGMALDMRRYNDALNAREALIEALEDLLNSFDALLCPVAPTAPYPAQAMPTWKPPPRIAVGDATLPYFEGTVSLAIPFSLTGHPVITLPIGIEDGLPVGVQIVGRRWDEATLLGVSARLEEVTGGFQAPPAFSRAAS